MSRQTNLRTMEKRIYDLEKNGGGSGSVKWSDVTYKPFKTLDSNDFKVEGDKLKLKNGGGASYNDMGITNNNTICYYTDKNIINVLTMLKSEGVVTCYGGWKVSISDTPSDTDVEVMTTEELNNALTLFAGVTIAEDVELSNSVSGSVHSLRWDKSGVGYGDINITIPPILVEGYKVPLSIITNHETIVSVIY